MTMIERVAQAIHDANREGINPARAAIEAMREPTEEIRAAIQRENSWMKDKNQIDAWVVTWSARWRTMIDAALKE